MEFSSVIQVCTVGLKYICELVCHVHHADWNGSTMESSSRMNGRMRTGLLHAYEAVGESLQLLRTCTAKIRKKTSMMRIHVPCNRELRPGAVPLA